MCKSKKKLTTEVMEPNHNKPRKSSSSSSSTTRTSSKKSSSSTTKTPHNLLSPNNSTQSFIINNNSQSWASSTKSSHHSLTSLKESLLFPEQQQSHIYNFQEIRSATQNFLKSPLSSSSTSTSWKCNLHNQQVVVIQRKLRRLIEPDLLVGHVAMICKSHHSSLIPLKGVSISGNYIYLVYEYTQGVNLSEALRNPRNPNFTILSNWGLRMQIASDIASGLDYIHNSTGLGLGLGLGFVHNHIKSRSIIVTENSLNAKICHFGTAELCGETKGLQEDPNCEIGPEKKPELKKCGSKGLKFEGTRGYMAPEFQWTGMATVKSDVYAFGVVILELISGKEAVKYEFDEESGGYVRVSVIDTAAKAAEDGGAGLRGWVDKRLRDSYPVDVAEKLLRVGLECVENNPNNRPDMGRVAGRVSQMYLESKTWADKFAPLTDFTVSLGPR